MDCICKFDPNRDISETAQVGFVVLSELLKNGVLPANLNVADSDFNDISDPKAIYGRPADQFDAMVLAKELHARAALAEAVSKSTSEGSDGA